MSNLTDRSPFWNAVRPFLIGGAAGSSATCCIQPIDMVKVRIQLQGEGTGRGVQANPFRVAKELIATDGFFSLYKGLSAGILRQLTYGLTRLGVFRTLTNMYTPEGGTAADISFPMRFGMSLCAGGIGALVGTPADAALVRMQSDSVLPPDQRRGYKNAIDALLRMAREEGLNGFFSGASPTIMRGLAINVGMLTTYDPIKKKLSEYIDNAQAVRFVGGAFSGWCAATVSLPFDFIKTRMQKDRHGQYRGFFDCVKQVAKQEGVMAFYNGYFTFVIRITPHIMLTWVFMDNYNLIMKKFGV